ncbi:hypothetical protein [Mesorhizobium sp. 113-3-3]|uniref:hypothetical protein n=1 Tax=Mesorhizobium sp. 113-3-3 TaxID=2744516 RepID=UPI0019281010|nr:hypothetical protein [Mesorhizobium sp. 113-3-3]BCG79506.1 hypothetical protein MesoLj113b_30480 [Mesorhizobium sp. 113-3-3]
MGFSGATFAEAEVTTSEECQEDQPGLQLRPFVWLKANGKAGRDDFGIATPFRLVISKRILDLLESLGIPFAVVEPYDGQQEWDCGDGGRVIRWGRFGS